MVWGGLGSFNGPESGVFWRGLFWPIFRVGRFGQFLGWVVSAFVGWSFRPIFGDESFRPWFVSAKVYRNYLGMTGTDGQTLGFVTVF